MIHQFVLIQIQTIRNSFFIMIPNDCLLIMYHVHAINYVMVELLMHFRHELSELLVIQCVMHVLCRFVLFDLILVEYNQNESDCKRKSPLDI